MRRITAILLTAVLLICSMAALPVSAADRILEGEYTFMDTCYSPELDIYIALAKDMTKAYANPKNAPGRLYYSEDGENWIAANGGSGDFTQFQTSETRQNLVWWKEQGVFVATANNKLRISSDGKNWKSNDDAWWDKDNSNLRTRSNTSLATNGRQLVAVTGSVIRTYDSIDEQFNAYQVGSGLAMSGAGVSNDDVPVYLGVGQNYYRIADGSEPPSTSVKNTLINENKPHEIVDVIYSDKIGGWLVLNLTNTLHVVTKDATACINYSNIALSDGTSSSSIISAAAVNDDVIMLGTADGKIFTAPNSIDSIDSSAVWTAVNNSEETEAITAELRSFTAVGNDKFLAASADNLYFIMKDGDNWLYHCIDKTDFTAEFSTGSSRIEIPEIGNLEVYITPKAVTWLGKPSNNPIADIKIDGTLPNGMTAEKDGERLKLTVSSETKGEHEISFVVTAENGQSKKMSLTVVDEASIRINGFDELLIPEAGEPEGRYEYTAEIIATDGEPMTTRKPRLDVDTASVPSGVTFTKGEDGASVNFVISTSAKDGKPVLRAVSPVNPSIAVTKEIELRARRAASAEVISGAEELTIPDSGEVTGEYTAKIYDQVENEMPGMKIVWSVEDENGNTPNGVSINSSTGILTVTSQAYTGSVNVKASAADSPNVCGVRAVTLSYTDKRKVKEDLAWIGAASGVPIENDLNLGSNGKYGSRIRAEISDMSLLKPDGRIVRPSREDKRVNLKVNLSLNNEHLDAEYDLIIKKADTLCVNGDFADGTYDGWTIRNNTTVEMESDDSGNKLKVAGAGVYQSFTFTNESSYGFEAVVSAEAGSNIRLVSAKGGTLASIKASGSEQSIKAYYSYSKQSDTFDERIYLECDGVMRVAELKVYEITLELNAAAEAVDKAVYSKNNNDIKEARAALEDFYDLPIKTELAAKLDGITVKPDDDRDDTNNKHSGGGGGGSYKAPAAAGGTGNSMVLPPEQINDNYADELDTYLLNFKDMKNHWAREDVEYMAELEIVNGTSEGVFSPDNNISRAEFAALIVRTMGLSETEYENSFFDIVSDDWYSGYVQTVKNSGFMSGYDGLFNPNEPISREEIAKVIVEAYTRSANEGIESGGALYFSDLENISFWAYDYIVKAVNLGFMNGISEEIFSPKSDATRAQAAVMLRRVYDRLHTEQ